MGTSFSDLKQKIEINGLKMAYVELGQGDPLVFLHGNPASSYIWRNIIPYLEEQARVIVPDLIGCLLYTSDAADE